MLPEPLFYIGSVGIDMYSIFILIGLIACFIFTYIAMKKSGYSSSARDTILIIGIVAIALGFLAATLVQSIYDFIANPSDGFQFTGKMTFLGGLICGVVVYLGIYFLYVYVINPRLKENSFFKSDMNKGVWELLRFAPISITVAHAFGRCGCFCAGCCGGIETDAWYGIQFPGEPHKEIPTQLFEAIFLFIITGVMIALYFKLKFKYNMTVYLIGYGIWRFFIEFIRGDVVERGKFVPGLTPSQFWSILMVIGGVAFYFLYSYFDKKIEAKKANKAQAE